jgi:hypothetical protein
MTEMRNRFEMLGRILQEEGEEGRDWGIAGGRRERNGARQAIATSTPRRGGGDRSEMEVSQRERNADLEAGRNSKRTVDQRSPQAEELERNIRRKVNEFDMGELFEKILNQMEKEVENVVSTAQEGLKGPLKEGMEVVMAAMGRMMSGISDGMAQERIDRDSEILKIDDRLEKVEAKVKELESVADSLTENRIRNRVKESAEDMERKVGASMSSIRVMDMDLGILTDNKKEIVKATVDTVTKGTKEEDKLWLTNVLRRTRIVVLGKETQQRKVNGKDISTVPILFCCQNRLDAGDLDTLLRKAGMYPGFHWPEEILDFVAGVRSEVRKMGVDEKDNFIRIRPEERDGQVQIRADSKPKNGGRFVLKGIWRCPPANKYLWDGLTGLYTPRLVGRQ